MTFLMSDIKIVHIPSYILFCLYIIFSCKSCSSLFLFCYPHWQTRLCFPNISLCMTALSWYVQYEGNWRATSRQSLNRSKMAEDGGPRNRHFSENNRKCHNFAEGDILISYRVWSESVSSQTRLVFRVPVLLVCERLCFNDRLKVEKCDLSSCYMWSRSNSTRCESVHARKRISSCSSCSESWNRVCQTLSACWRASHAVKASRDALQRVEIPVIDTITVLCVIYTLSAQCSRWVTLFLCLLLLNGLICNLANFGASLIFLLCHGRSVCVMQ